jgi:hypothetical protein
LAYILSQVIAPDLIDIRPAEKDAANCPQKNLNAYEDTQVAMDFADKEFVISTSHKQRTLLNFKLPTLQPLMSGWPEWDEPKTGLVLIHR